MPTVLRTFPEISRVGHQETPWSAAGLPVGITSLQLQGVASQAVLSNTANSIDFVLSVSPDGTDANPLNTVINREPWHGGVHPNHQGVTIPNIIDVAFGPLDQYIGWKVKLAVDIPVAMVVGAVVQALP